MKTPQEFACDWNKCQPGEHDRGTAGCGTLAAVVKARDEAWADMLKKGGAAIVRVALRSLFGSKEG